MAKRVRPYIHQTVVLLTTRFKEPNETDWQKLVIIIKYLNGTNKKYLTLSADDLKVVKWYVDASFTFHPDSRSHYGEIVIMGQGVM